MLLEELLSLPVGTRVSGEIEVAKTTPGVVASRGDGSHFIRWDDGFASIALGNVREYDEYIAAHTELQSTRCISNGPRKEKRHEQGAQGVGPGYASRVRRT